MTRSLYLTAANTPPVAHPFRGEAFHNASTKMLINHPRHSERSEDLCTIARFMRDESLFDLGVLRCPAPPFVTFIGIPY
jgi:hypothetical protein